MRFAEQDKDRCDRYIFERWHRASREWWCVDASETAQ
jgi:hypothetical protein